MKKKIVIISTCIIVLFISLILTCNKNVKKTFKQNGITYALTLDGSSTNSFSSKGLYEVNATCTNAKGKWDYDAWKLYLENITGDVSCDIEFNTITKTYLNDKVKGLAGTTQGTGQVVNENGYRYEGKDPNNYVWFNNELWRIIGVFDSATHGQTDQNLVKIIRESSIGGIVWNGNNDWTKAKLYKLFNPIEGDDNSGAYYYAKNGTGGTYCYGASGIPTNCDYTQIGIKENYRNMIKKVTWHVGAMSINSSDANYYLTTVDKYYTYERGVMVYSGNPTETTGYIGLMYPSDYGYSVLSSSCARTTNLSSYNTSACAGQSWLYSGESELTLTPTYGQSYYLYHITNTGKSTYNSPDYGFTARPALYLDSSAFIYHGDGSRANPFIIGM